MLGRSVAQALVDRGDAVTVFQRRPSGLGATEILGSVTDPSSVAAACEGAEAVVHLAAKVHVVGAWSDYEAINVGGTRTLLEAAGAAGVRKLVYVSSPSVAHHGGSLAGVDADPADPARARGLYSRSKAEAEQLALAADGESLSVVAVRPHLVWGPGDTQLVGRIVARARTGRLSLIGDGSALIDTTYVDNASDAIVAALDRAPALGGQAFVVSNGEPRPIAEILQSICAAAGLPGPRMRVPFRAAWLAGAVVDSWWTLRGREDDPPLTRFLAEQLATAHWFDQRRTREALGWQPRVTLEEGFDRLAASFAQESS